MEAATRMNPMQTVMLSFNPKDQRAVQFLSSIRLLDFFLVKDVPSESDPTASITPALRRRINKARKESQQGETIRCNNKAEMLQYFDSL
jgi:hypothetical protein